MKLEIVNVSKNYGSVRALCDVNLTLEPGIYGLLGPNGAGKSTLINLITDSLRRETGKILWDGRDILEIGAKYRSVIGYMPQQQGYYEDFTAGGFLTYMARLKGMNGREAKNRTKELLEVVNLGGQEKKLVGSFSGGMKQRLLIAQALIGDPKVLILDEPTAGVDPQERIRIRNFISETATDKIVILATHIVSDVEAIAGQIVLLREGQIISKGAPYELLESIEKMVYEIDIPAQRLKEIEERYIISNIRNVKDGLAVKIVTDSPPADVVLRAAVPNLEDVYLWNFR